MDLWRIYHQFAVNYHWSKDDVRKLDIGERRAYLKFMREDNKKIEDVSNSFK